MSWQSRVTRLGLRRTNSCWLFSTATGPAGARNIGVGQGGRLSVRLPKATALVRITTAWTDKCDLIVSRVPVASISLGDYNNEPLDIDSCDESSLASNGVKIDVNEALQHVSVTADEDETSEQSTYLIQAVVPEMFSLDFLTANGNVNVINKLKGDCHIHVNEGDINLGVVRGERTNLVSGCGRVVVKELEGNVDIAATKVRQGSVSFCNYNSVYDCYDGPMPTPVMELATSISSGYGAPYSSAGQEGCTAPLTVPKSPHGSFDSATYGMFILASML